MQTYRHTLTDNSSDLFSRLTLRARLRFLNYRITFNNRGGADKQTRARVAT